MNKKIENPESIFIDIKKLLFIAVKDRKHSYHTPVFSNLTESKTTQSRIVVLRKFDETNLTLNFHTDFRSPKIKELKKNDNTSFLFYDSKIKIQLRINTISNINNKNKITEDAWKNTNLSSRKCYLTKKIPSSVTNIAEDGIPEHLQGIDPLKSESEKGYNNFTVIQNKIQTIDWLFLNSSGHRRLNIDCNNNIQTFNWLIP